MRLQRRLKYLSVNTCNRIEIVSPENVSITLHFKRTISVLLSDPMAEMSMPEI